MRTQAKDLPQTRTSARLLSGILASFVLAFGISLFHCSSATWGMQFVEGAERRAFLKADRTPPPPLISTPENFRI